MKNDGFAKSPTAAFRKATKGLTVLCVRLDFFSLTRLEFGAFCEAI
jgi:hypothetical protein